MNPDDNDKLWELLGKTRQPTVSPFFSRNVLRAVRQEEQEPQAAGSLLSRFFNSTRSLRRWTWQVALAGTCAVAVLINVSPTAFVRHHHSTSVQAGFDRQIVGNPDYETIKHLDELVADEESSLWLDDTVN
jgi:hypothetical protein